VKEFRIRVFEIFYLLVVILEVGSFVIIQYLNGSFWFSFGNFL